MTAFTDQELKEMALADEEIEQYFESGLNKAPPPPAPLIVWVSRLARQHHTTYGKFVSTHTNEEILAMVQQLKETYLDENGFIETCNF